VGRDYRMSLIQAFPQPGYKGERTLVLVGFSLPVTALVPRTRYKIVCRTYSTFRLPHPGGGVGIT